MSDDLSAILETTTAERLATGFGFTEGEHRWDKGPSALGASVEQFINRIGAGRDGARGLHWQGGRGVRTARQRALLASRKELRAMRQ